MVPVGRGAEGFDVSPNGREVWAANAQDGTISVLDLATRKVVQTLAANVMGANRLKFTPDRKAGVCILVAKLRLAIFNAATRSEVKRVKIGRGAAGIQMQPDKSRVFVACTPDEYVVIIDLKSLEVTGNIDAGKQPDGVHGRSGAEVRFPRVTVRYAGAAEAARAVDADRWREISVSTNVNAPGTLAALRFSSGS